MKILGILIRNAMLGFMCLLVFNWVGGSLGLSLGVNALNTGVLAVLGVPGFGLLLLIKTMNMQ